MPSRPKVHNARLLGPLLAVAVGLLQAGCIWNLPKDLVVLSAMDSCPDYGMLDLAEHTKAFDHTTSSDELRCALHKLRTSPIPYEVHWTGTPARICYLLADRTSNPDDRDRLAAEGVRWAEIAYEHGSPEPGRVQYYMSINLGLAARDHAALALKNVRVLEKALLEAVALAPEEEQGGPLRLLGTLYLLAPPWPDGIGDSDKAMKYLRRAVREYPDHPLNLVFLALALVDAEEEAGAANATMLLKRAKALIEQGPYGDARARWMKELKSVAGKGELSID